MTQAFPLQWPTGWPRASHRSRAKFGKSSPVYKDTGDGQGSRHVYNQMKDLSVADATQRVLYELGRLGVKHGDAIISTMLRLRNDGLPRSDQAAPSDPGVAVYWKRGRDKEMKVMAIDRYDRVQDNMAAIAATLEAMRAIERHGGGQILERAFTGFDALPPPRSCWQILGLQPGASRDEINAAFRELAGEHHPDRGGSHDRMAEISRARDEAIAESR